MDKVIQLYEVVMTRHTTMVVGQTGGGKTVIINTLARAQVCDADVSRVQLTGDDDTQTGTF